MLIARCLFFFCTAFVVVWTSESTESSSSCSAERCVSSNICRPSCPIGCGPFCALTKCINGTCQGIEPCSVCQCTNASQCMHSMLCKLCVSGYGPFCTQSVCLNGRCHNIMPCSKKIKHTCKDGAPCFHPNYCESKCPKGRYPQCATSKCFRDTCIQIAPYSLYINKYK